PLIASMELTGAAGTAAGSPYGSPDDYEAYFDSALAGCRLGAACHAEFVATILMSRSSSSCLGGGVSWTTTLHTTLDPPLGALPSCNGRADPLTGHVTIRATLLGTASVPDAGPDGG